MLYNVGFRYYGRRFNLMIRTCCFVSVISVCMNTPQTFRNYNFLRYVTVFLDLGVAGVLLAEMSLKMRFNSVFYNKQKYFRSAGRLFELLMVTCITISIILQICEMTNMLHEGNVSNYLVVSLIRVPRPLMVLRIVDLEIPDLENVAKASLKQVLDIIVYMFYFLIAFALIGGQLFGVMNYFCVNENVAHLASDQVTNYSSFTIPIKRCPPNDYNISRSESFCPKGYVCKKLSYNGWHQHTAYFSNILQSFVTIYEAMSLEGEFFLSTLINSFFLDFLNLNFFFKFFFRCSNLH